MWHRRLDGPAQPERIRKVPDEYPIKPVFDGAGWSRRVRSGHSKPALFPSNPRFWFRNTDFRAGGRDIRFPPVSFPKMSSGLGRVRQAAISSGSSSNGARVNDCSRRFATAVAGIGADLRPQKRVRREASSAVRRRDDSDDAIRQLAESTRRARDMVVPRRARSARFGPGTDAFANACNSRDTSEGCDKDAVHRGR